MGFLSSLFGMGGGKGPIGGITDMSPFLNQRSAAGQAASMMPPVQSVAPVAPPVPRERPVTAPLPRVRPGTAPESTPTKPVPIPPRRPEVLDRVSQNPEVSAKNVETPWPST
jgi:hypothetical protein